MTTPDRTASGRDRTVMFWIATAVAPRESVTRSLTGKVPFLEKVANTTPPPASSNRPSLSRSHSTFDSGPSGSPDVDDRVTGSSTNGLAGDTEKAACGGAFTLIVRVKIAKPPPTSLILRATVLGPE